MNRRVPLIKNYLAKTSVMCEVEKAFPKGLALLPTESIIREPKVPLVLSHEKERYEFLIRGSWSTWVA